MEVKRKLVYILHDFQIGGVEVALLSAIPLLYEKYELRVVVLGGIDEHLLSQLSESQRLVFKSINYPLWAYPLRVLSIVRYVIDLKPDLLVCSLWRASWVGAIVKRRMPAVRFYSFIHSSRFFHKADAYFSKLAISVADVVLVDSLSSLRFVGDFTSNGVPVRRVSLLTHHTPSENKLQDDPFSFGEREIKFLFMGSVSKVKNLPLAIDFIADLRSQGLPVILDIYGRKDNDFVQVAEHIHNLKLEKYVKYRGEADPFKRFGIFASYDFYIQLSEFEGMAMSVAEAMQNGLVCVVTPVGEIPNYSVNGDSAIFLDCKDDRSWSDALQKIEGMINDPSLYIQMSMSCHNNFLNKQTYANSLIDLLMDSDLVCK